jgi:hypothetical protein
VIPTAKQWGFMSEYHRARIVLELLNDGLAYTNAPADYLPKWISKWMVTTLVNGLPKTPAEMINEDARLGRVKL